MKFPEYTNSHCSTFHIPALSKGMNFSEQTHSGPYDGLSDCKNVWFKNGVVSTRPGLFTSDNLALTSGQYSGGIFESWEPTNIEVEINGDIKRIIVEAVEYDIASFFYLTHIINSNGTTYKSPALSFRRMSSNSFYYPQKIHIYKGKPQGGSGIFAFVYLVDSENSSQADGRVFELNSDYTEWQRISQPYIPTALINGRGNKYETAKSCGQAYTGTPTELEGLNILDGTFYSYFSTDGCSSSFRLPYSNLSNDIVVCRLYDSVNSYVQWVIGENQTSATTSFWGVHVTVNVNRERGIIYFTVPAGEYEVPLIYNHIQNNLRVTATKNTPQTILDIAMSDGCFSEGNTILFGAGNKIFQTNYNNPLYFPVDNISYLGSKDCPVTGFCKLGNYIAAFKKKEIYFLSPKEGERITAASLLADTDAVFYRCDSCEIKFVSDSFGCESANLMVKHNGHIFFLAADKKVYSLENSGKITPICQDITITDYLSPSPFAKMFAISFEDNIMFVGRNQALVFTIASNSTANCYFWKFHNDLHFMGAFSSSGKAWFVCRNFLARATFLATLQGDRDMASLSQINEIEFHLRTTRLGLGCDNNFKKIDNIILNLKGNADIYINDRLQAHISRQPDDKFNLVRLNCGICTINLVDISFSGTAPAGLGSIDINFTPLKV